MYIQLSQDLKVKCQEDAEFTGLWEIEHDQDPTCVKSRTDYLIEFVSYLLIWVSKLQTCIALSTMKVQYIALSYSIRDLIIIRRVL